MYLRVNPVGLNGAYSQVSGYSIAASVYNSTDFWKKCISLTPCSEGILTSQLSSLHIKQLLEDARTVQKFLIILMKAADSLSPASPLTFRLPP